MKKILLGSVLALCVSGVCLQMVEANGRFYETFTIEFGDFNPRGESSLNLMWENTMIKIPLQTIADLQKWASVGKN